MKTAQEDSFLHFLLTAKQRTYAAQGDEASVAAPLLRETRQLEWRMGDWLYRDIYAGLEYFVGQEIVYWQDNIYWSMSYAGGIVAGEDASLIYRFLRAALHHPDPKNPLRGPSRLTDDKWIYQNMLQGDWRQFQGNEIIMHGQQQVYALTYGGGYIR